MILVEELAGDQGFASLELVVRTVREDPHPLSYLVLDLRRVTRLDLASLTLLTGLVERLAADGVTVVVVDPAAASARAAVRNLGLPVQLVSDTESALELCEADLLQVRGTGDGVPDAAVPFAELDLLHGLAPDHVEAIASRTTTRVFTPGTLVFDEGADSDGVYFVSAGHVSIDVRMPLDRTRKRLTTVGAGGSFGEMALLDGLTRSARAVVLEPTICRVLSTEALHDLLIDEPAAYAALVLAIARGLSVRLRYTTAELAALDAP